jgi:hypothetical protein
MFWILNQPVNLDVNIVYGTNVDCPSHKTWVSDICPNCGRIRSSEQIGDLCIEVFGIDLLNFVWIDDPSIIINQELRDLLINSGLSGFNLRDVEIVAWYHDSFQDQKEETRNNFPRLFQMVVVGKGGSIFPQNISKPFSKCDVCGTTQWDLLDHINIDEKQWDGSDVFNLAEFPGYTIVTEKFCKFLEKKGITGYRVTPSHQFSMKR